jgi:hypothetical protein
MPERVLDPTEAAALPPRILQGTLLQASSTLYLRTGDNAELISVLGLLRRYRDRPIVLIIFDPSYKGGS